MPENFNLNQLVLKVLKKNNINNLTDVQLETFNPIVEGQNILVNAHTGTGKTLSFLIPLYEKIIKNKQLKTLILAPSRELANQIYNECLMFDREIESKSICIIGGVNQKQQIESLNKNWNNLICTPGRAIDLVKQKYINLKKISLFIIDESDMMLDFGFINDIYWINDKLLNKKQTLLFSATNNKISTKLSNIFNGQNYLNIDLKQGSKTNSDVTNLLYFVSNKNKSSLLIDLINRQPGATYIIFMNMIKDINYVARELFKNRIAFEIISSEKSQRQRQTSIEKFKNYQSNVLIATDVISRGIHIDNIDFIINYNVPKQLDTFIHRVGRTGRMESPGTSITFCDQNEYYAVKRIINETKIKIIEDSKYCEAYDLKKINMAKPISEQNFEKQLIGKTNQNFFYDKKMSKSQNAKIKNRIERDNRNNLNKKIDTFQWGYRKVK